MKCFYHRDLDGACSGAIVKMVHSECEMISIDYGDDFPWESIQKDEQIFMVDFGLQPFDGMEKLNKKSKLVWIDHHKSVIEEALSRKFEANGGQSLVDGTAGCELTWKYFKDEEMPAAVKLLGRYDVWDHSDAKTLPFQFGMRLLDTSPDNQDLWMSLFDGKKIPGIVREGKVVLKYLKQDNAKYCKACSFETELDGLKCIAVNRMSTNSQLFDSVWDPKKYDAMLSFGWSQGQWEVSLYSTDSDIDVGAIAKKRGGGGHKGASGFECKELPFELVEKSEDPEGAVKKAAVEKAEEESQEEERVPNDYAEVKPSGDDSGREITVEEVLEKFDSFLIRRPFISLVGGLAVHGKTKGDIDILIKAGTDLPESFTIPLEFRILRMFDPEDRDRVHFVYDRYHGPFTSFYELADLKIEQREKFRKVEMSQGDGSGAQSRRDGGRQKQTHNSPTFAYIAVYGKEPEEFLSGRTDHPERIWNGIPVDEPLKNEWLDALKAIEGIEVRASCCGHSPERVSYIVFRLKSGCDVDAKRVSEKLNRVPGCYSIADVGDAGKMRIVVAGKVWEGKDGWAAWWERLANRIQKVVTELEVNKTLDPEAEKIEEDLGLAFSFEEIEKSLREEEFPEEFTDRARFFIEMEKSEFQLTGEAGVAANREARQSMESDRVVIFRRFYPLKTAVSGLHAQRVAEVYSLGQSLSYLSDLYARGVR